MQSKFIKIGVLLIAISFCIIGYKNREELYDMISNGDLLNSIIPTKIEDDYEKFITTYDEYKKDLDIFNEYADYFYDNFIRKNRAMTTYIDNIEKDIKKLEKVTIRLNDKCSKKDNIMTDICINFKTKFINLVETYNKLIENYNKIQESFNEFAESNFRKDDVVEKYKSILKDNILDIYEKIKN